MVRSRTPTSPPTMLSLQSLADTECQDQQHARQMCTYAGLLHVSSAALALVNAVLVSYHRIFHHLIICHLCCRYDIAVQCWQVDPALRPSFAGIERAIADLRDEMMDSETADESHL